MPKMRTYKFWNEAGEEKEKEELSLKKAVDGGSKANKSLDARLFTPLAPTAWKGVFIFALVPVVLSGIRLGMVSFDDSFASLSKVDLALCSCAYLPAAVFPDVEYSII